MSFYKNFYLLIILLISFNAVNAATWITLGKSESAEYQYDSSIISGSINDRKLTVKVNVIGDAKDNAKSRLIQFSVNCNDSTYLMESMKLYDSPDLIGNERNVNISNMKRVEAKPKTIGELYVDAVCKQAFQANKPKNSEDSIGAQVAKLDNGTKSDVDLNFAKFGENDEREMFYGHIQRFENFRSIDWIVNFKKMQPNGVKSQHLPDIVDCKSRQTFVDGVSSYSKDWNKGSLISRVKEDGPPSNISRTFGSLYSEICSKESYPINASIKNKWDLFLKNYNEDVKKQEDDQKRKEAAEKLEKAKEFPYYAVLTCTSSASQHIIESCFVGDYATEIELKNGKQHGHYKVSNFNSIGQRTNNGFVIDLRGNFELTTQNSSKNLILGIKLFNRKTDEILYQKQVPMFGVISIKN